MRVFYHENTNSLIALPFRNGSTHLLHNLNTYNLTFLNLETQLGNTMLDTITNDKKINKIFFYRNPIDRFLSFYVNFIVLSKQISKSNTYEYKNQPLMKKVLDENYNEKLNIWNNLYNSLNIIEEYYNQDEHTQSQYNYFIDNDEEVKKYNVYDFKDYNKWIFLTFGKKNLVTSSLNEERIDFNLRGSDFFKCMEIHDTFKKIYKNDLNFLAPMVKKL
jgi:hypothetical protein